jgi:hypothetical protein
MILKLPPHRPKGISHGDIRVFMGMPFTMFMLRDELRPRGSYLDTDFINTSLMQMFVGKLDDYMAVNHVMAEFLKAMHLVPNARLNGSRGFNSSPCGLNWQRHCL